ncbi:biotin--[acetyl-CoA-carboxylase] ligase [Candidatus Bipolaricaulota sp. J31]
MSGPGERCFKKVSPPSRITHHPSRWVIVRVSEVDSTQDVARARGEVGTVVMAEVQRRGRGRRGATWHSPRGGLWLSAILPPPAPLHIQVAKAVARALAEHFRLPIRAVPPNDLELHGKKLGGVLVETDFVGGKPGPVIVGIGINVNNLLPEELEGQAISLGEALGRVVDLEGVLALVLSALEDLCGVSGCRE